MTKNPYIFVQVLLYDFFQDSPADANLWRVVLNGVQDSSGQDITAPWFDPERHAGLCIEVRVLCLSF